MKTLSAPAGTQKIILKDTIIDELRREGFTPGQKVSAEIRKHGAAWVVSPLSGNDCVVYPEDYVLPGSPKTAESSAEQKTGRAAWVSMCLVAMHRKDAALYDKFVEVMGSHFNRLVDLAEREIDSDFNRFLEEPAAVKLSKIGVSTDELKSYLKERTNAERQAAVNFLKDAQAGKYYWRETGDRAEFNDELVNLELFGIEGNIAEILKRINLPQNAAAVKTILHFFDADRDNSAVKLNSI